MSKTNSGLSSLSIKLPPVNLPSAKKMQKFDDDESDNSNDDNYDSDNEQNNDEERKENKEIYKIDPEASFFASFIDGSSFRYLIEYLRLTTTDGVLVFSEDYITYQREDEDKTVFNDVKIKTYELTDYEFNSFNKEITAAINLSELRNKTRTVGKKEQMDIYRRPEEPSNFYIQVRSQEKSSGDNPVFYCMPMKSENVTIFELPVYARGKHNPNCTIYQTDFSKVCKALIANKCSYADFIGYDNGIIIKGYTSSEKIAMVKEYGKCRESSSSRSSMTKSIVNEKVKPAGVKLNIKDTNEVERFRILNSTIKSLAKINGFSSNGTLKFYIEKDAPMKIVSNIGSFGKLTVLIRSVEF